MTEIDVIGQYAQTVAMTLGLIALFCGACLAGAGMLFGTIAAVRWMREHYHVAWLRAQIHSPAHYGPDSDLVVLPRAYFEELLPPHLIRAWTAILNRFRHQPWPPCGCSVSVVARNRNGTWRPITPDDLKPVPGAPFPLAKQ